MAGSDLRSRYEGAVLGLRARVVAMRDESRSSEMIARAVHAERTRLAAVFKELTPEPLRSRIHGPAIESLQSRGKSWDDIIDSATGPGPWISCDGDG